MTRAKKYYCTVRENVSQPADSDRVKLRERSEDVQTFDRVDHVPRIARKQFSDILKNGFPRNQRDKMSVILANVANGHRQCFLAHARKTLLAVAVLQRLEGLNIVRLEYLAVAKGYRDRGIGGQLFDHLVNEYHTSVGLVFEVDSRSAAKGRDRNVRTRRVEFYRRHGADIVTSASAYQAPSARGSRPLQYELMWRPLGQATELSGESLRLCVAAILTQCYELQRADPFVRRTLKRLRP
jgi:GNAT superfamily N-acetyltransferase